MLTKTELLTDSRQSETEGITALFASVAWIAVDDSIAERAGSLAATHLRAHPGIEVVDFVIAATAQEIGAELWTRNVRHFPMFPGLQPPY